MKLHRSHLKTEGLVLKSLNPDGGHGPDTIYIPKYPTSFVGGYNKNDSLPLIG